MVFLDRRKKTSEIGEYCEDKGVTVSKQKYYSCNAVCVNVYVYIYMP